MSETSTFSSLGLGPELLKTIMDLGYEAPTPIQERTIPALLAGRDVIGQAQTGTGKTAAFALPMLSRIDVTKSETQGLVLAPTRELAMQVAEAIHSYAHGLGPLVVLPVYGGAPIFHQLKRLERGVHIVVGTPGRLIDMLDRKALKLDKLRMVVLDEADEMLKMGFIEDVERILGDAPSDRQTALFSATMPDEVLRIAKRHLKNPERIALEHRGSVAAPAIAQRFLNINESQKLEVLTQILELEESEATLIFRRTKNGAAELAEKLQGRGFAAEPMHGDMNQSQRESVIRRLRAGQVEVVVATDVAARGLDVEQIEHVINYDVPNDVEAYVHRIGRTGRAGRKGVATLFVTPRERRMMREIERFTGMPIKPMKMPTRADVAAKRVDVFKDTLRESMQEGGLDLYLQVVEELVAEGTFELAEVAAAAAKLANGARGLVDAQTGAPAPRGKSEARPAAAAAPAKTSPKPAAARPKKTVDEQPGEQPGQYSKPESEPIAARSSAPAPQRAEPVSELDRDDDTAPLGENDPLSSPDSVSSAPSPSETGTDALPRKKKPLRAKSPLPPEDLDPDAPVRLRMEVGRRDGIRPADVVGSIANEAGISGRDIGPIDIRDDVTFVSIPAGSVDLVLDKVGRAKFRGRPVNLRIADADDDRMRPKPNPEDRRPPRAQSETRPPRPPYGDRKPGGSDARGPKREFRDDRPSRDDDRRPARPPYAARGGARPGPGGPKPAFRPGGPPRKFSNDRPPRDDDRRPPRAPYGDRGGARPGPGGPKREFRPGGPPRKFSNDRPPRDDDRRPPRAPYGDRGGARPGPGGPKREFRPGGPPRKFSSDRPPRDDDRRPARAPYGDRSGARPGPGGPKREFRPGGPPRNFSNDRPSRPRDDARPPRRDAASGARPSYPKRPFTKSAGGPVRRGPAGASRGPGGPKKGKK